jgi:hypothetical protein
VGLATAGGLAEIAAGVLGTAATWIAPTASRAAGGEAEAPRLAGACERQARGFLGGELWPPHPPYLGAYASMRLRGFGAREVPAASGSSSSWQ